MTQVRDVISGGEPATIKQQDRSSPSRLAYDPPNELLDDDRFASRYEVTERLGEGGMGVVDLCVDRRIGREIAMKTARAGSGSQGGTRARFLREARVQGQLEHPAIVPVHDLGRAPDGAEFFTMKRVRGLTLDDVLNGLRRDDEGMIEQYSRRRLLTAFLQVALAVHFAHTRGVLHRDLKPGNIMLGHFGEVYVLDWGLAKLTSVDDDEVKGPPSIDVPPSGQDAQTIEGELMGTPGYMAPEQVSGDHLVDARADVYALGAILFEIITLETLHPRFGDVKETLESTIRGAETRLRAPERDVPPELEEVCRKATMLDPAARYETARALCDAIERFLDGDRDMARRISLSLEHASSAGAHADRALAGGAASVDARRLAMRDVSRALVLDPTNQDAMRTVVRLLTEPPRELPPEAQAEVDASAQRTLRVSTRVATLAYFSWAFYVPLVLWMGIRDFWFAAIAAAAWALATAAAVWVFRQKTIGSFARWAVILLSTLAIGATSTAFGPFVILPSMAAINATMLVVNFDRSLRAVTMLLGCLAVLGPAALGAIGVLPRPYAFGSDAIVVLPQMLHFPEIPTTVFLVVSNIAIILTACLMVARIRDSVGQAERRLQVQAWQLRQLFPPEAQAAASHSTTTVRGFFV